MRLALVVLALIVWAPATAAAQTVDPELRLARQTTMDQGLFFALARNDLATMTTLRTEGANPNASLGILGLQAKDVFGDASPILDQPFDPVSWPILHWAVFLGNLDAARLLLRGGARVNAVDVYGATALHWAAWGGRHSIAKLLLNNGASCWATDIKKRSAKDWAVMTGQNDIITLLASRACRPGSFKDADGDGVPDHLDLCRNTPKGAPVDERGCWVVAYANFFDFDKSIVKSQYLPYLASAAEVLNNAPDLKVIVQGHADWIGSDAYNLKLGLRRAEAVKRVLAANGVNASRLALSSMGEGQPISDNRTSRGRALNRRVEIHVAEPGARLETGSLAVSPETYAQPQPAPPAGKAVPPPPAPPARP